MTRTHWIRRLIYHRICNSGVAWRVGQPDSILPKMMETGRVGFHLEVLKGGAIEMTDVLRVTRVEPDAITVAALSRLLLSQSPDDLPALRKTLALPALGLKARNAVRQRINLIEDKQRLQIGRWRGWRSFIVSAVHDEAESIRSFYLRPQDGQPTAPPAAGQFLTVRLEPEGDVPLIRPWTISGVDEQANEYRVTIRKTEGGRASKIMHEGIGPGSRIDLRPPAGQFTLDRSGFRRIAMLSGGIGATPLLAMLKEYTAMGGYAPSLLWLQVVQNGRTHPFRSEVGALLAGAPRVQRVIWYSQPDREDVLGRDYDREGRPTAQEVEAIIRPDYAVSPFGKEVLIPGTETEFYICGPVGLEAMIKNTLSRLGVRPGLIRSEAFAAADANTLAVVETAIIHFSESGISRQWHVDDGMTLLDLAEAAGLEPPFACRSGVCQSCRCRMVAGQIDYNPTPTSDPGPESVLLCCARPASETLTIAI